MTVYYLDSAAAATAAPYDTWAKAALTMNTLIAIPLTNADTVYVSPTHAGTSGALANTMTFPTTPGLRVLTAADNTTAPPTALAAFGTRSSETANSGFQVLVLGCAYIWGMEFKSQSPSNTTNDILIASAATTHALVLDGCKINQQSSSTGAEIRIGSTGNNAVKDVLIDLIRPVFGFGSATGIIVVHGTIKISGAAIVDGATAPTTLFTPTTNAFADVTIDDSDLTGESGITNLVDKSISATAKFKFRNCKITTVTLANMASGSSPNPGGPTVEFENCGSGDTHMYGYKIGYEGTVSPDIANYRTAGAIDSFGTRFSLAMVQNAAVTKLWHPLRSPEIWIYNAQTGSSITVSVEVMRSNAGSTKFTDAECWIEVHYITGTDVPSGSMLSDRAADVLATPAAQDAADDGVWTEVIANQTFQKLSRAVTPTEPGWIRVQVALNSATSGDTAYVDPYLTVSGDTNTYKVNFTPGMGYVMYPVGGGGGGLRLAGRGGLASGG